MNFLTGAISDRLTSDAELSALLATYEGAPAVFTTDPVPGDATMPFIVSDGEYARSSFDTKTTRGQEMWRDIRCYAPATGSALLVEIIAERVLWLLHRWRWNESNWSVMIADASGPIAANSGDAYGRIISIRIVAREVTA